MSAFVCHYVSFSNERFGIETWAGPRTGRLFVPSEKPTAALVTVFACATNNI